MLAPSVCVSAAGVRVCRSISEVKLCTQQGWLEVPVPLCISALCAAQWHCIQHDHHGTSSVHGQPSLTVLPFYAMHSKSALS